MSRAFKKIFDDLNPVKISKTYVQLCAHYPLIPIKNDMQMRQANLMIDRLVSFLGDEPKSSEASDVSMYLNVLSDLVGAYESKRFEFIKSDGRDLLAYLMESNHLKQTDLADEIGSQSVVSDILSGKRSLNLNHIKKLAARFNVSPALFIG